MKRLFVLALPAVLLLSGCAGHFNSWTDDCLQMGGIVSRTHAGVFVDRYECFVDGDIVTVPGYEGE